MDDLLLLYSAEYNKMDVSSLFEITRKGSQFSLTFNRDPLIQGPVELKVIVEDGDGATTEKNCLIAYSDIEQGSSPDLRIEIAGNQLILSWSGSFDLYGSPVLGGVFRLVEGANSPYVTNLEDMMFYFLVEKN